MNRRRAACALLIWCIAVAGSARAAVKAWVDNDQVAAGDTVVLTLSHDGQTGGSPDLAPLSQDFDVLSRSRSSNVQFVNGSMSSETRLQLTLAPKHTGQLTIPALSWDNETSPPVSISVGGQGAGSAPSGANDASTSKVFLRTSVDQPHPYVQGAVNVTVRIYASVPLYQASLDLPANSDVLVEQLGSDRNTTAEVDGRQYQVVERHYVVFPQHSGTLSIPGPVLDAQIPARVRNDPFADDPFAGLLGQSPLADMMRTARPIRVHADAMALDVRPRPAAANASYWIPAKKLTVTGEWHPDSLQVRTGEPLTLDLHLEAEGLTAAQLPDIAALLDLPPGIKAYPDQAKLKNDARGGTIVGRRDQSVALIADKPGEFSLPATRIQWWDTQADQLRETELPGHTVTILPGGLSAPPTMAPERASTPVSAGESAVAHNPPEAVSGSSRWPWPWVSLGLAVLWLGTTIAWWISHRRPRAAPPGTARSRAQAGPDARRLRGEFQSACARDDAPAARRALLGWAAAAWAEPPVGLRALAKEIANPELDALLLELDRACYAGDSWQGAALSSALSDLPTRDRGGRTAPPELAPLHP